MLKELVLIWQELCMYSTDCAAFSLSARFDCIVSWEDKAADCLMSKVQVENVVNGARSDHLPCFERAVDEIWQAIMVARANAISIKLCVQQMNCWSAQVSFFIKAFCFIVVLLKTVGTVTAK